MKYQRIICFMAIFSMFLFAVGCGSDTQPDARWVAPPPTETGPDYSVPPEKGGPGFEEIAEELGWSYGEPSYLSRNENVKKGGRLTFALSEFPPTYRTEGRDSNSAVISMIGGLIYESLLGLDSSTLEYYHGLATHFKIEEDNKTFWFRLNPNAYWADGYPVTADDVLYSWRLMVDEGILAPYINVLYNTYEEPEVISKYIVRVRAKELNWRLFLYFGVSMSIYPAHYLREMTGAEYLRDYQYDALPGTGPYYLDVDRSRVGRHVIITRRDDYWNRDHESYKYSANFDEIRINIVREDRLQLERFKRGELDFYFVSRASWWVQEFDFDEVRRGLIQRRRIYTHSPQGISGFAFNMRVPPFNDINVRLAINHLFNRQKLIENLFFNEYEHLDSYYPNTVYENPNNPVYRYDMRKAEQYLEKAGYTQKDRDGYLINQRGDRLEFDLRIDQGWNRIMAPVQEDFRAAGVKMNIQFADSTAMFKLLMERQFRIHYQSWTGLFFPNPESSWHSTLADPDNTNNITGFMNERMDEICEEYNVEFCPERRIELIRETDRILMDEVPYALGWYTPADRIVYWNKFGQPKGYLGKTSDWRAILSTWWYEPELDEQMQKARRDRSIQMEVGETTSKFWDIFDEMVEKHPEMTLQEIYDSL